MMSDSIEVHVPLYYNEQNCPQGINPDRYFQQHIHEAQVEGVCLKEECTEKRIWDPEAGT